jgi:hypothetical protein
MVLLAIKYNEDDYFSNEYYAKVGGISLPEINMLEAEAFQMMNFSLFVEEDFYEKYYAYLMQY